LGEGTGKLDREEDSEMYWDWDRQGDRDWDG
jgi:hypothetical protein